MIVILLVFQKRNGQPNGQPTIGLRFFVEQKPREVKKGDNEQLRLLGSASYITPKTFPQLLYPQANTPIIRDHGIRVGEHIFSAAN